MNTNPALALAVLIALLAGGCTTPGAGPSETPAAPATAAMATAIRAAGEGSDDELDVRPLRDTSVEDLRARAVQLEAQGDLKQAAALLDQALELHGADPAVLQERAEIAVLLGDFDGAVRHARRAIDLGAGVGPLCRRHWATIEQVAGARLAQADATVAAQAQADRSQARAKREACTIAAPARY